MLCWKRAYGRVYRRLYIRLYFPGDDGRLECETGAAWPSSVAPRNAASPRHERNFSPSLHARRTGRDASDKMEKRGMMMPVMAHDQALLACASKAARRMLAGHRRESATGEARRTDESHHHRRRHEMRSRMPRREEPRLAYARHNSERPATAVATVRRLLLSRDSREPHEATQRRNSAADHFGLKYSYFERQGRTSIKQCWRASPARTVMPSLRGLAMSPLDAAALPPCIFRLRRPRASATASIFVPFSRCRDTRFVP